MSNGSSSYQPETEDLQAQTFLQNSLLPFIYDGVPGNNLQKFDVNPGWPANFTINVIKNFTNSDQHSVLAAVDYRENICTYYKSIGLSNQSYWWAN